MGFPLWNLVLPLGKSLGMGLEGEFKKKKKVPHAAESELHYICGTEYPESY